MKHNLSSICGFGSRFAKKKVMAKMALSLALALPFAASQAAVAPISVSGNKVLFGGVQGSVSGNSMFWSNNGWDAEKFYSAPTVSWLKNDWNSKLVRAAMGVEEGGGYLSDRTGNVNRVKTVVDAAIANDMYVIIDWHSHHADLYRNEAITFFQDMARTYGGKNNVIYEVFNEPLQGASWSGTVKPYAQAVVNAIRAIDPDNLIIVGSPTWSQDVDVASRDKIQGTNIAYALHFYAATHKQAIRDKAQTALDNGAALFVTEWGSVDNTGNGAVDNAETDAWVNFMKANQISNANWALNDKPEGASALYFGASGNGGWAASQLTPSGVKAKGIIKNWPALGGGTGGTGGGSSKVAAFKTYNNVNYLSAANNGGGTVDTQRTAVGDWEKLTVIDVNGGTLNSGDQVQLKTGAGWYLVAEGGGGPGSVMRANRRVAAAWETFTITKAGGGQITNGSVVNLRTNGYYVTAIKGGGIATDGAVMVDRTIPSTWEGFKIIFQ